MNFNHVPSESIIRIFFPTMLLRVCRHLLFIHITIYIFFKVVNKIKHIELSLVRKYNLIHCTSKCHAYVNVTCQFFVIN